MNSAKGSFGMGVIILLVAVWAYWKMLNVLGDGGVPSVDKKKDPAAWVDELEEIEAMYDDDEDFDE